HRRDACATKKKATAAKESPHSKRAKRKTENPAVFVREGNVMAADDLVVAITGASGSPYAVRLLEVLLDAGRTVHLSISPAALRAADVRLKARRELILVPRETPLGLVQLRNLTACAEAGAVILPAMPAFYTRPKTLSDAVDFIVGRVCDQLGVEHGLLKRWGEVEDAPPTHDD